MIIWRGYLDGYLDRFVENRLEKCIIIIRRLLGYYQADLEARQDRILIAQVGHNDLHRVDYPNTETAMGDLIKHLFLNSHTELLLDSLFLLTISCYSLALLYFHSYVFATSLASISRRPCFHSRHPLLTSFYDFLRNPITALLKDPFLRRSMFL